MSAIAKKKFSVKYFLARIISNLVQFTPFASTNIPSKRELLIMSAKFLALYCASILDLLWLNHIETGSLLSLCGPTFQVTPFDLCIIFQCNVTKLIFTLLNVILKKYIQLLVNISDVKYFSEWQTPIFNLDFMIYPYIMSCGNKIVSNC